MCDVRRKWSIGGFLVMSFVYNRPYFGCKKHTHFAGGMLFFSSYFSYIKASNLQLLDVIQLYIKCSYFRWKIYQSFEEFCSVEFEITHYKSAFSTKPQPLFHPKNCLFCFTKCKHRNPPSIIIVLCSQLPMYIALQNKKK